MVSEQAVDGSSPLDTMIQRLQQEQDQRLGANDSSASAAANSRASRGKAVSREQGHTAALLAASVGGSHALPFRCFPHFAGEPPETPIGIPDGPQSPH